MAGRAAFKAGRASMALILPGPKPVETLWASCAGAARSLCTSRHKILGYAVNEIFALQGDPTRNMVAVVFSSYCFERIKKQRKVWAAILDGYVARL